MIPGGEHRWPFSIKLPRKMKLSSASKDGSARIVYELRAILPVPGDRDGRVFQQILIVPYGSLAPPATAGSVPALVKTTSTTTSTTTTTTGPAQAHAPADDHAVRTRSQEAPVLVALEAGSSFVSPGAAVSLQLAVSNRATKTSVSHLLVQIQQVWMHAPTGRGDGGGQVLVSMRFGSNTKHFPLAPRAEFVGKIKVPVPPTTIPSVDAERLGVRYELLVGAYYDAPGNPPATIARLPLTVTVPPPAYDTIEVPPPPSPPRSHDPAPPSPPYPGPDPVIGDMWTPPAKKQLASVASPPPPKNPEVYGSGAVASADSAPLYGFIALPATESTIGVPLPPTLFPDDMQASAPGSSEYEESTQLLPVVQGRPPSGRFTPTPPPKPPGLLSRLSRKSQS